MRAEKANEAGGARADARRAAGLASSFGPWLSARRAALALAGAAYAVVWCGGVASHFLRGGVADEQQWLASLFLLLAAALTLLGASGAASLKRLAAVFIVGFAAEAAGVRLGVPFGAYQYTDVLRPQLLGVPVVIAAAWMTLAAYVKQVLGPLRLPLWAECVAGAAWLTAIDLLIDPLAAGRLGYWRWLSQGSYYGIPAANFAGWFVVGLPAMLALRRERAPNLPARAAGLSVVLFFTLLAAAHGLRAAALVGLGLCAADLCAALRLRRSEGAPEPKEARPAGAPARG